MVRAVRLGALLALVGLAAACGTNTPTPASPTTLSSHASPSSPSGAGTTTPLPALSGRDHAPADFVDLSHVDPSILTDIRYATAHNFVGRPVAGYLEPRCLLTRQAAQALSRVQTRARAMGYSLKVYDCYRPQRAGEDFAHWAADPADHTTQAEFYPDIPKSQLFADGYVGGGRTSHSRGSTMDLTLVALPARTQPSYLPGQPLVACTAAVGQRFPDNTIDMGTGFDCFDSRSHTLDPRVTATPRDNRLLLRQLMASEGFVNYANEWWHYDYAHDPYPNTYFDFPVTDAAVG